MKMILPALTEAGDGLLAAPKPVAQIAPRGELKYRKYFTTELRPEDLEIGYGALRRGHHRGVPFLFGYADGGSQRRKWPDTARTNTGILRFL